MGSWYVKQWAYFRADWETERYIHRSSGGFSHDVWEYEMEMGHDADFLGGIRPNRIGLHLLVRWWAFSAFVRDFFLAFVGRYGGAV